MTPAERAEMRRFRNRTLVVAGVLLGVAAVLWLVWRLSNLIFMVFVALFVTIAFEPAVHWLEKKGWKRGRRHRRRQDRRPPRRRRRGRPQPRRHGRGDGQGDAPLTRKAPCFP